MSDIAANATQRRQQLREGGALAWLQRMIEIRAVEDRVVELFFEGQVPGTTHTCQGQEAVSVGIAVAARPTDTVACTYRGHGHALALGIPPRAVLGEILGRVEGTMRGLGGSMHLSEPDVGLLPTFAIVGAGIPVAAGAGLTAQVAGTDDASIAIFGDGATNIGAFHEGLNLAAIWKLPCLFIIENNLYGEYSRIERTTPIVDLVRRADAYGIPGESVDGQTVSTVIDAVARGLERARAGEGPTVLEMRTYRYAGHSRSDKAEYRPEGELSEWLKRDPIDLLDAELTADGTIGDGDKERILAEAKEEVEVVVTALLESPKPQVKDMFTYVSL